MPILGLPTPKAAPGWGQRTSARAVRPPNGDLVQNNIVSFELHLHDSTPSCRAGLAQELVFAPRLDNLGMCHAGASGFAADVRSSTTSAASPLVWRCSITKKSDRPATTVPSQPRCPGCLNGWRFRRAVTARSTIKRSVDRSACRRTWRMRCIQTIPTATKPTTGRSSTWGRW